MKILISDVGIRKSELFEGGKNCYTRLDICNSYLVSGFRWAARTLVFETTDLNPKTNFLVVGAVCNCELRGLTDARKCRSK